MNLRQRCQAVFKAGYQFGQTSFRHLALKTNFSKSSVHRLYHRIVSRNQHPESELWETEAGQKWLRLLVLATIFVFALQGGIGCQRLSQFFHLLRLQRHIGVSPTAVSSNVLLLLWKDEMDISLRFITTDEDYPPSDYKFRLLSIISL